jgi:hypothetical protein
MISETGWYYLTQESTDVFLTNLEQEQKKLEAWQRKAGDTPINEHTEEDLQAILKRSNEIQKLSEERQRLDNLKSLE